MSSLSLLRYSTLHADAAVLGISISDNRNLIEGDEVSEEDLDREFLSVFILSHNVAFADSVCPEDRKSLCPARMWSRIRSVDLIQYLLSYIFFPLRHLCNSHLVINPLNSTDKAAR